MRKIIFIFLFFCLTITTILAQVVITNIATPNSNGLSNNQVDDFDVTSDGTILNNSTVGGTATLGSTTVTANPNITAGSEASLILLQVTGTTVSDLNGTIEVFGSEAGLIIANPNGIDCDGCGFINTNRVDLVTGTANFTGDDLTGFSIDDAARFFVSGNGFVSDAVADELNLVSRDLRIQTQVKANTTLRVLAGNDTYNHTTNIITSDATEASAHSIQINASGNLEANYIELISTEISSSHGILNAGGDIEAGRLKLDSNGLFRNQNSGGVIGNINISGLLEVITADRFINNGNITADTLTITTDAFSNNDNGGTQLGKIFVTDTFSLSTPNTSYTNTGTVSVDTFALSVTGDFDYVTDFLNNNINTNINTNRLNLNVGGNFTNNDSASDFTWGAQNNLTVLGTADITTNNYIQYGAIDVVGVWTIIANADFTHSNTNNDFIWDTNDSLTVTGNADITTNNFANSGTISAETLAISVAGDFDYSSNFINIATTNLDLSIGGDYTQGVAIDIAGDLSIQVSGEASLDAYASIQARNLFFSANDLWNEADITITENVTFDIVEYFRNGFDFGGEDWNGGAITAVSFNATAGKNFLQRYYATIRADNFNVTVIEGTFRNIFLSSITNVKNFNVTTGTSFENEQSSITNVENFNVTTGTYFKNEQSSITNVENFNVTTGTYFANHDFSEITAVSFNVTAERDFVNNDNSTINVDNFNVTAGEDFVNTSSSTIAADTVTIEVANFDDDIDNTATVSSDSLNFILTADFTHNSTTLNGFDNFSNLGVSTEGSFTNNATINPTGSLTITANSFANTGGVVNVDTFNLSINNDFDYVTGYRSNGTITDSALNLNVAGNFSYDNGNNFIWLASDSLTVAGNATIDARTRNYTQNGGTIDVAGALTVSARNIDLQNGSTINVGGTLSVSATNSFTPRSGATISVDTFDFSASILQNQATFTANYGTINISGTNTQFFNNSDGDFNINNSLDIITAGEFSNYGDISAGDTLTITLTNVAEGFVNHLSSDTGNINTNTFNLSVAGNFDYVTGYRSNGIITDSALNLSVGGNFSYDDSANDFVWGAQNNLTVLGNADITTFNYNQSGIVDVAGRFDVTTTNNFVTYKGSTLNVADGLYVAAANGVFLGPDSTVINDSTISADTFDFTVGGTNFNTWGAKISANNGRINLTHSDGILNNYSGEINVTNNFDITTDKLNNVRNIIVGDTLTVTLNSDGGRIEFSNTNNHNHEGISADTFNFSVASDFDYLDNYLNEGTITTNALNLQVGGDFSYFFSTIDFIWAASDILTVLGNADITVNNYTQNGAIDVTGALTINAGGDFTNFTTGSINAATLAISAGGDFTNFTAGSINAATLDISAGGDFTNFTTGSINAATLAITVGGGIIDNDGTITTTSSLTIDTDTIHNSGDITANTSLTINATNNVFSGGSIETSALAIDAGRNFGISGSITTDSLNITAGYTALNTGTIVSGSLDLTTDDFFRNLAGGDISVDSLNITAGGKVTNIATINAGTLNIIANNDSSRTDDTTDFYVSNRGDITVTNLINITAVDNFYNTGNLTADTLAITAKDIIFLNTDSIEPYDGGDIVLSGDSSFIADGGDGVDGGIVVNRGNIDLGVFNLDITANRFINHADATIDADTLNLDVSSFVQNGFIDAIINQ